MPSVLARKTYLQFATTTKEEGVSVSGIEPDTLDQWVKDTEGFSIAHLRELVAASFCLEQPYAEVLKRLKSMTEKPKFVEGFKRGKTGFSLDENEETEK